MIKMANYAYERTGSKNLVMAGGVALNSVANGRILDETPFEDLYIQPEAGDAGGALRGETAGDGLAHLDRSRNRPPGATAVD